MIRSTILIPGTAFILACHLGFSVAGTEATPGPHTEPCETDLHQLAEQQGFTAVNRSASPLSDDSRTGVRLDEQPGDGVAWLQDCTFSEGVIEFDVRGKDVQGQSFVGIAFHGANDSTYDAVYLRPFNFRVEDPARRDHAVQYVSHPVHTWFRLRGSNPEEFENPVQPAPDPNDWVHVRVVLNAPKVSVFVGEGQEPDLEVDQLSNREQGRIGLWVGNNSGGDFANLRVAPAS